MGHELIVFAAFAGLQAVFHNLHRVGGMAWCKKCRKWHWVVWFGHPVVIDGVHEFLVHIVIYSGFVMHS